MSGVSSSAGWKREKRQKPGCFGGPGFGAGDCPANGEFSIRHTTRNFPNREGSKPGEGQMSAVALMDARSIAATAANGGKLTAATDLDIEYTKPEYYYNANLYAKRVYNGWGHAEPETDLRFGPNIKDWPEMPALTDDLLVKVCSYITDPCLLYPSHAADARST